MNERLSRSLRIVNIFSWVDFGKPIDLRRIAELISDAEYDPEMAAGLILRSKRPKACFTLYGSGKARCTGAQSMEDAEIAVKKIVDILSSVVDDLGTPKIEIRNLVCVTNLQKEVNLIGLAEALRGQLYYEPEQFPGAVLRGKDYGTALIFQSGKIVMTEVRTIADANRIESNLRRILT